MANLSSAWANQTQALSDQNSRSLTATALTPKERAASGPETVAGGSDIVRTGSGQLKENTVNLKILEVSRYEESQEQTKKKLVRESLL